MRDKAHWDARYIEGDLPWDTGRHERQLAATLGTLDGGIESVLELGCGTGTNAIWLARQGLRVTAADISPAAIEKAVQRASAADVQVAFAAADLLTDDVTGGPFDLVFDRGCFHSIESTEDQAACVQFVHRHLVDGGRWLSMMGNADEPPREVGPPRRTALQIVTAVEPLFEILRLETTHFDSRQANPPRAWACLMRKR